MTKQLFTASDYAKIHSLVFKPDYPGYKPNVVESPNGDGKKDDLKRYAHVAEKYLHPEGPYSYVTGPGGYFVQGYERDWELTNYLDKAHQLSIEVAISIGVSRTFWPVRKYGALRVLEYGGDAVTNPHTDFDLFTLMLYRNLPEYFKYCAPADPNTQRAIWLKHRAEAEKLVHEKSLKIAQSVSPQVHFGEILEEIDNKTFCANDHTVVASRGPSQYSIVYFAAPSEETMLPSGQTVGQWMIERKNRSRYER